jgi:ParB/RepB/Spo0J family partition protein
MPEVSMIPLQSLDEPPFPMRAQFGDIPFEELCQSIRVEGVLEPLLVRPVNGRFQVMAGHRRLKAATVCALGEVPCIVRECSEEQAVSIMVHENTGREEVTAAEEGWFYCELVDRFKYNEGQLCTMVKKSPAYVNERIDLVRNDPEIADAVKDHKIVYSVARELLRVNPYTAALVLRCRADEIPADKVEAFQRHRAYLLDLCIRSGATARVARSYVEQWKVSFVPTQPYQPPANGDQAAPEPVGRQPRCLVCGRDGDPQNMLDLKVHYWEKDGVLKILRAAGIECHE